MSSGNKTKNRSKAVHVGGDQNIIQGNVSGSVIVQGRNAKVKVQKNTEGDIKELATLFEKVYQYIESRVEDPNLDKDEITGVVQQLEVETAKGEQANQVKLSRWMEHLGNMAPDIIDVILGSLGGPVSGFSVVLKKIAERAQISKAH
jgi:hypothetical protein